MQVLYPWLAWRVKELNEQPKHEFREIFVVLLCLLIIIGVEIVSGKMFLVAVPDRCAKTLFEYMKRYIRRGSIVTVGKGSNYENSKKCCLTKSHCNVDT